MEDTTCRNRTTILIVEDDPVHEELVRSLLQSHGLGCRWLVAGTLAEARERLADGGVDVVLLDLGLPDSEGLETLRALTPRSPSTPPIVVVTGHGALDDVPQAIRIGAQDFLIKGEFKGPRLVSVVTAARERRQCERDLIESEERFRAVFKRMGDGMAVYQAVDDGADFVFTDYNPAAESIDGLAREDVLGRRVSVVFPAIEEFGLLDVFRRVWKTGVPMEHPVSQYKDDRLMGWRENFVFRLPTDEVATVYRDLTAQKQTEQSLADLSKYPETNPNPVLRITADGNVEYANPAARRIMEHLADDEGRLRKSLRKATSRAVDKGRPLPVDLEAGEQWFVMTFAPLEDAGAVHVYGLDVTERKLAELALRESQSKYQGLFNSIRDAILVADTDRRITDCNPAFTELFGYELDEIRGKFTHSVYKDEAEYLELGERIRQHFANGGGDFLHLVHYRKKSGDVFPGETNVFFLRDTAGETRGFIGLIRDISKRLEDEKRLRNRAEMESLLSETATRLLAASPEEIDNVVSGLLESVCRFSGVDRCCLVTRGGTHGMQCLNAEWHRPGLPDLDSFFPCETPQGNSWWFEQLEAGAVIHIKDVEMLEGTADDELRSLLERGVRSIMAVPLNTGGRLEGYLSMENLTSQHEWTEEDILLLETFAGILVSAKERARTREDLDWSLNVKDALAKLYKPVISPQATLRTISMAILQQAKETTGSPIGCVATLDEETNDFVCRASTDTEDSDGQRHGEGGTASPLWRQLPDPTQPLVRNAPLPPSDAQGQPEEQGPIKRLLSVPVHLNNNVVGQIALANKPDGYSDKDLEAVRQMGEYFALALERLRFKVRVDEAEDRFLNVVESMHEGMLIVDEAGSVSYANQRMAEMMDLPLNHFIGHQVRSFVIEHQRADLDRALSGTSRTQTHSLDIVWQNDGQNVESLTSLSPILDDSNRYRGAFFIVHDITERKKLERQLLQAQKLESIGQLAAGVAHEINTPAQYVQNNIQFLERTMTGMLQSVKKLLSLMDGCPHDCPNSAMKGTIQAFRDEHDLSFLAEELPDAISESLDGVQRISEIVRSVKQFAHPGEQEKAPTDLNETVRNTVLVSTNEWKYVADLQTDLAPELPPVQCNDSGIKQVLLNLIVNAAQAIEEKRGSLPERKGRITVTTRREGDMAAVSVADTGAGMPPQVKKRVFDPFYTTKQVGKGTGQGLSIAHSIIVENHGGSIDVESEEGQGSTFTIKLPFKE